MVLESNSYAVIRAEIVQRDTRRKGGLQTSVCVCLCVCACECM
jgi:hypothetical protein